MRQNEIIARWRRRMERSGLEMSWREKDKRLYRNLNSIGPPRKRSHLLLSYYEPNETNSETFLNSLKVFANEVKYLSLKQVYHSLKAPGIGKGFSTCHMATMPSLVNCCTRTEIRCDIRCFTLWLCHHDTAAIQKGSFYQELIFFRSSYISITEIPLGCPTCV